jgi:hypothetical protein
MVSRLPSPLELLQISCSAVDEVSVGCLSSTDSTHTVLSRRHLAVYKALGSGDSWRPTRRRVFANSAVNCFSTQVDVTNVAAVFFQQIADQSAKTRVLSVIVGDPHELIETTLGQLLAEASARAFKRSIKQGGELGRGVFSDD